MKIAFSIPAYYPAVIGESLYAQDLAAGLIKKGHEVHVYTNYNPRCKEKEIFNGVTINRIRVREILGGKFYFSSEYLRLMLEERFDIIHSHHYGYFPATSGLVAAKAIGVPHAFGPYYHPPVYGRKRWMMFLAYHLTQGLPILRLSDSVLPHTEYEKKMLLKIGAKEENMTILPNNVNTKIFRTGGSRSKIVLFVGNLIQEKGARVVMDMAKKMLAERNDTRFVFVGNPYEKELIPMIERLKKDKRVTFLSNINNRHLLQLYQKAAVLLLPSRYEAFSRVIAEAEACGTPIVATRVGAIPEVVKDEKSGFLVDYGEWEEMRDRVQYILDNPSISKSMGRAGRNHIVRNFDTDIIVKKLIDVYKNITFNH